MTRSRKAVAAWKEARVQSYAATRSAESLVRMLVDLEDTCDCEPEFRIDEEWPASVRNLQVSR